MQDVNTGEINKAYITAMQLESAYPTDKLLRNCFYYRAVNKGW